LATASAGVVIYEFGTASLSASVKVSIAAFVRSCAMSTSGRS
jgi:hypothetical protein